jgi:hypothetical protein
MALIARGGVVASTEHTCWRKVLNHGEAIERSCLSWILSQVSAPS